jgi:hypothetical protein
LNIFITELQLRNNESFAGKYLVISYLSLLLQIIFGIEIDLKLHALIVGLFVGVGGDGQHCAPEPYTNQQQLQVEIH